MEHDGNALQYAAESLRSNEEIVKFNTAAIETNKELLDGVQQMKPLEVDIMVAEVGDDTLVGHENNTLYVVKYDGFISEHKGFCVIGGNVDDVQGLLKDEYSEGLSQGDAVKLGLKALMRGAGDNSALDASTLEVCILDRSRSGRKFTRVPTDEVQGMLDA